MWLRKFTPRLAGLPRIVTSFSSRLSAGATGARLVHVDIAHLRGRHLLPFSVLSSSSIQQRPTRDLNVTVASTSLDDVRAWGQPLLKFCTTICAGDRALNAMRFLAAWTLLAGNCDYDAKIYDSCSRCSPAKAFAYCSLCAGPGEPGRLPTAKESA